MADFRLIQSNAIFNLKLGAFFHLFTETRKFLCI